MDLKKRLEEEHSKTLTTAIVNYVGDDKKRFKELMTLFLGKDSLLSQRAAWPLSYVALSHPNLLTPYFEPFLAKLDEPFAHPAIARNIFRILQRVDVPEKFRSLLLDKTFKAIMSEMQPAAIRAFAITVAVRICRPYPELKSELLMILNELSSYPQKASMKARIKMALKALKPV